MTIKELFVTFLKLPDCQSYLAVRAALVTSDYYEPYSEDLVDIKKLLVTNAKAPRLARDDCLVIERISRELFIRAMALDADPSGRVSSMAVKVWPLLNRLHELGNLLSH